MRASICDVQLRASGHRQRPERLVWPTEDICGMSFLGEGLQLVVTPAVLSVAVPGVLHHLKEKSTTWRVSGREQGCGKRTERPSVSTELKSISADAEQLSPPLITQPSA